MKEIVRFLLVGLAFMPVVAFGRNVVSRAARVTNTPTSGYTYNYMYPYMNNQMRTTLNPGNANDQSTSPINAIVRTSSLPGGTPRAANNTANNDANRRVVSRSGRMVSGGGTGTMMGGNAGGNRNIGGAYSVTGVSSDTNRRVAQRGVTARAGRADSAASVTRTTTATSGGIAVSAGRCLSDYTECMNNYCVRSDTPYNRCFCSSRLSQIESTYEPQIDSLIKQILSAQTTSQWTDAEMAAYWNERIGQYVGENTWEKLDDALNIDWPSASERMQGQGAYLTGHQYCMNHLTNCAYASANMRDVYRSEISRDCDSYEKSLDRLKTALETVLDTYTGN